MNTLKQRLLNNWGIVRIFRLGIGLMMLVMAFQSKDWTIGLLSSFFLYQAITDTGCCGSRGCSTPVRRTRSILKADEEVIEYDEIK